MRASWMNTCSSASSIDRVPPPAGAIPAKRNRPAVPWLREPNATPRRLLCHMALCEPQRASAGSLAAMVLLCLATACVGPGAADQAGSTPADPPPTVVPTGPPASPSEAPVPGPARKPTALLRPSVDPTGLVVPEGGTARFTAVLTNAEPDPIAIEGLPPTLTLYTAGGEAVRTFPGGTGAATIPPGGAYRHEVVWDLRRSDGTPARPGRYGAGLARLAVRHAGGTWYMTMGLGTEQVVVVEPAGGARAGVLPLGLAATDQGTTLTLDRLVLDRTAARLEAHATPAWPRGGVLPGSPLGHWSVAAEYRLDGAAPIRAPSPGFGVDDPTRTGLTWRLDALPATARELELTVRLSGALARTWSHRIQLPAPTAGPAGSPTPALPAPASAAPHPVPPSPARRRQRLDDPTLSGDAPNSGPRPLPIRRACAPPCSSTRRSPPRADPETRGRPTRRPIRDRSAPAACRRVLPLHGSVLGWRRGPGGDRRADPGRGRGRARPRAELGDRRG